MKIEFQPVKEEPPQRAKQGILTNALVHSPFVFESAGEQASQQEPQGPSVNVYSPFADNA